MRPKSSSRARLWFARALVGALAVAALLGGGRWAAPAQADDTPQPHEMTFRRAEIRERSFGDLEKAAELYKSAAERAPDERWRARAELRAASCLARAGHGDEAEALAQPWIDAPSGSISPELRRLAREVVAAAKRDAPPPTEPDRVPAATDPRHVETLLNELEQARLRLAESLDQAAGVEKANESLAAELRVKERENASLRKRLPPPEPDTAEDLLKLRQEDFERQRREARAISELWTRYATLLHQDGRFAEAREVLYDALSSDSENADAKALLERVGAPLGDRERLYLRIREVLALAREVRKARLTSETLYLVQQGRRAQERGDLPGSVAPLERALALVGSELVEVRAPTEVRDEIEAMLRVAEAAGAPRSPAPAPIPPPLDERWVKALRGLLSAAGNEVEQGLDLRFHDLDALLPSASTLLPPAPLSRPPEGWSLSTRGPSAARLLAAWLAGGEHKSLAAPGASLEAVGSTVVALTESDAQLRLQARLASAVLSDAPASELQLTAIRAPATAWQDRLSGRGLESRRLPGGARVTILGPSDVDPLTEGMPGTVAASATFRVGHLQPFRLSGGASGRSVSIDVLAVTSSEPGVAVEVESEWRPIGRSDAAVLSQRTAAGAPLARGGALALHGLTDPADASRDLVVIVRLGRALPRAAVGGHVTDAETDPGSVVRITATEHLLPRSLARVHEITAPLLPLRGHEIARRPVALLTWLKRAAPDATSIEISGGRVLVVGEKASQDRVRAVIDDVARVRGPQRFRVEAFLLSRDAERALIAAAPSLSADNGRSFASAILPGGRVPAVRHILANSARSIPIGEPVLASPATVRADAAHVVRTPYRRDLDVAPGEATSWGRAETGYVDQGFVLALRPFGRDARGRDVVDLSLRLVRVVSMPSRERETALGAVQLVEPLTEIVAGDLPVSLRETDVLLLAALPSPFGGGDERMVLVVSPAR